jgi:hypothetical protein
VKKGRLVGVIVTCMRCQKRRAKWVIFNFFLCDECAKVVDP